jgi:hypothetical protein
VIAVALGNLLYPTVVIADVRIDGDDLLTAQAQDVAQDTVGAGVVRADIEHHGLPVVQGLAVGAALVLTQALLKVFTVDDDGRSFRGTDCLLLAQRVAPPLRRQEDAAQIGVSGKAQTEKIIDLTLVPVGIGV